METLYDISHPIDRSYAKALQLINSRTDLAWKYLKEGNLLKCTEAIKMVEDVSDEFLSKLAADAVKQNPITVKKAAAPRKSRKKPTLKKVA